MKEIYHEGILNVKNENWKNANILFNALKNEKALNYKDTRNLLNLAKNKVNKIKADSCIESAKKYINTKNFKNAFELLDEARALVDSINIKELEDLYTRIIVNSLSFAQKKYKKKDYESAKSNAKTCLTYLNKIPFKDDLFKTKQVKIAESIINKCTEGIYRFNKFESVSTDNDILPNNDVNGRDMALAFNLLKINGKTSKIGWMLKVDIKNILEQFGYYNYTILGGTKIELYDQIVYQAEGYKNNKQYYIYLNSNLSYNQWSVTGICMR